MELSDLKKLAKEVANNAFTPHSGFHVGCSILSKSGQVFTGCNVESESVTFNICAERNAISTAISQMGGIEIDEVIIYTPTNEPVTSCGLCRQLIFEFGKSARVYSFCDSEKIIDTTIAELLPYAFDFEK